MEAGASKGLVDCSESFGPLPERNGKHCWIYSAVGGRWEHVLFAFDEDFSAVQWRMG